MDASGGPWQAPGSQPERDDRLPSRRQEGADATKTAVAMSIDVEEWFHVENLKGAIPRSAWRHQERRAERSMDRMLELMSRWNVKATCFVLGWVADRSPALVRRIADAGHEIASHGQDHQLVHELEPASFRNDVERSKHTLEEITGRSVLGYRAPSFSITDWALPILEDVGYAYDSSFVPTTISHDRYGRLTAQRGDSGPVSRHGNLSEVRLPCLSIGSWALPWGGGGYFRLLPYPVFRFGVRRIAAGQAPYVFYIHPWEIDPRQPRIRGLRRSERIRHYLNLEKTEDRWVSLMRDFAWTTIARTLAIESEQKEMGLGSQGVPHRSTSYAHHV